MVATLTEVKRHKLLGGMSNMKQLLDLLGGVGAERPNPRIKTSRWRGRCSFLFEGE
jgi:hypothetical protein